MKSNSLTVKETACWYTSKATSGKPYQIYMNLRRSSYGCNQMISPSPQYIIFPCKVFDTNTDIYFDIFQLCSDNY